jgi:cell division septation protein DedD
MTPLTAVQVDSSEDTEITLGTGKMLALFFGLVILCATFFGMGYSLGRTSAKTTAELLPSPVTSRERTSPQATPTVNTANVPQTSAESTPAQPQTVAETTTPPAATTAPAASDQPVSGAVPQAATPYFVQVAAVSKQEDAQALVESLKSRQYQAFIADASPDKLFHVQVGPFSDVKEAEDMRTRLVNDGYNPILKK